MNGSYLGRLTNTEAIKESPHNAIFSFVSLIFEIALINAPMLINKLFHMIKFTKKSAGISYPSVFQRV